MTRLWPNGTDTIPRVSSEFGEPHELTGHHRGIDLTGFVAVSAADDGTVVFAGWNGTAGYEVRILHQDGCQTRYLHLQRALAVTAGQTVWAGHVVGLLGDTGDVTGPHVHFEVIAPDGATRINPREYIGDTMPTAKEIAEAIMLYPAWDGGPQFSQAFKEIHSDVSNLFHGFFTGGPDMDDDTKPVDRTLAEIQDKLDALAGHGTPAIDLAELAQHVAGFLAEHLTALPDADVARIADAAADEADRRTRHRLAAE